ncbi:PD-(D/E)XK motif protein [Micrococcus luteus]|uniref:PD-(D/E)XK motif protein n=1 Tax=Micrococcus luteus TaxID=1270 RepID=UPI003428AEB4
MLNDIRNAFKMAAGRVGGLSGTAVHVQELRGRHSGRRVWLGQDAADQLVAFIEYDGSPMQAFDVSQIITVSAEHILNETNDEVGAVQIRCLDAKLDEVFFTFLADVIAEVDRGNGVVQAVRGTADDWRSLLAVARRGMGERQLVGLFGEVTILNRAAAVLGPAALGLWTGPDRNRHDFVGPEAAVEVKTSSLQNRQSVSIHGLRQLEPSEGASLTLAVVEVEAHPLGRTVGDLVAEATAMGVDPSLLREKLASSGFIAGMPGSEGRFKVVSIRYWEIEADTPVLRRSSLDEAVVNAISDLRYSLELSALGPCHAEEFDFSRLTTAGTVTA